MPGHHTRAPDTGCLQIYCIYHMYMVSRKKHATLYSPITVIFCTLSVVRLISTWIPYLNTRYRWTLVVICCIYRISYRMSQKKACTFIFANYCNFWYTYCPAVIRLIDTRTPFIICTGCLGKTCNFVFADYCNFWYTYWPAVVRLIDTRTQYLNTRYRWTLVVIYYNTCIV